MKTILQRRWRLTGVLGVVGLLLARAGPASAQSDAAFPRSFAPEALAAWVRTNTDLPSAAIAAVSASGTLAVLPEHGGGGNLVQASIWIETLDPQLADAEGVLSWSSDVVADCAGGRLRFGAARGFARRKRQGPVVQSIAPDAQWRAPSADEPSEAIWRAMCSRPVVTAFSALNSSSGETASASPRQTPTGRALISPASPQPVAGSEPAGHAPPSEGERGSTIQLAAMPSAAAGERVRREISSRFAGIVRSRVVQVVRAEVGRRVVYRVLISDLENADAAEDLCRGFRKAGQDCLVRPRRD
jgi:hypothetical protein